MAVTLIEDSTLKVNLNQEKNISVNLGGEDSLNASLPSIDYIPGYRTAEELRRENEEVRQENERKRIANESEREENEDEREKYFKDFVERVDSGEFKGDPGENGLPGEKGDPGVNIFHIGTEEPTDPDKLVWINPDGATSDIGATEEQVQAKETNEFAITPAVLDYAIKVGLTENKLEWTTEELKTVRDFLGITEVINTVATELDTKIESAKTELNTKIDTTKTELNGNIESAKSEMNSSLESAKEELNAKIDALEIELKDMIGLVEAELGEI